MTYQNGTTVGPIASNVEGYLPTAGGLPLGLSTVSSSQPGLWFDANGPQFSTVTRTGLPTTGLPSPYTANSELRYQASGGYVQRYQGVTGALGSRSTRPTASATNRFTTGPPSTSSPPTTKSVRPRR